MKTFSAVLLGLAVLALPTGGAQAATKKKPTCALSKKWDVVKKNSQVVVFTVPRSDGSESLVGCNRKNGNRVRMADSYDDDYVTSITFDQVHVNGRFVGWQWTSTDISCKADCPADYEATTYSIERADVITGKTLRWDSALAEGNSLRLSPKGNVAWVEAGLAGTGNEVRTGDSKGHRAIDTGDIPASSLKLAGTALSWTNAGAARSATLP